VRQTPRNPLPIAFVENGSVIYFQNFSPWPQESALPKMKTILAFAFLCFVTGCSALSLGENLPRALANHPDPETVGAALPA
jgi:hypothetical protein